MQRLVTAVLTALLLGGPAPLWAQTSALDALEGSDDAPASSGSGLNLDALEGDGDGSAAATATEAPTVRCDGSGPCIEEATQLPLRVLPRPFASLYAQPDSAANVLAANIPAFNPLYVYARDNIDLSDPANPGGWYQVGTGTNGAQGWLPAKDALEWKQALVVAYTHPGGIAEGRRPVLMFDDLAPLREMVDTDDLIAQTDAMYAQIDAGEIPADVVSMEPKRFVDINRQFYILPILDWQTVNLYGDDMRLLQLAAAVPGQRGADTLTDTDYRTQADTGRGEDQGAAVQDLLVDIVFVIDTTRSMQPYIDLTREAVMKMASGVGERFQDRVRFGLVGYQDSTTAAPKLDYASRNFTPELVDAKTAIELLEREVKATTVGSVDYAEEVFAGVDTALRSSWRDGALRFVVLIGDASGHPRDHAQSTTGKDETDLKREMSDAGIHLLAIHLQDERAAEDHERAAAQFGQLAEVRGSDGVQAMIPVNAFEQIDYQIAAGTVLDKLLDLYDKTLASSALPPPPTMPDPAQTRQTAQTAQQATAQVWEAALIEYLGRGAKPPKDIVAWAADRDLANPADVALEVRVLVTREQLSSLVQALDRVVQALKKAELSQGQFFAALQGVAGQTLKRPEDLGKAQSLAESGLLPAFIQSLPYKSEILSLTDDMYASLTAEQRAQLEWSLRAKLAQYRAINEQVDAWHRLNESDPDSEMVHPLHIDYLP